MVLAILALSLATNLYAATSAAPPGNNTWGVQTSPASTGGNLIYDNGGTDINTDSGNEMTNWRQADDFQLAANNVANAAECSWLTFPGGRANWDGSVQWIIYLDAAGSPGAVHASGNGSNIVTVPIGNAQGFEWYTTSWDLGANVPLTAGTRYWLSLHFSLDCATRDDIYLAYSVNQAFNVSIEQFQCAGGWGPVTNEDRAFKLYGDGATPVDSATWGAIKTQFME
jgi:hypothetical protein